MGSLFHHLTSAFPDVYAKFGLSKHDTAREDSWKYLHESRRFLWANRKNFKPRDWSFMLKGKDAYDPGNPPELPEEIRDPPSPEEEAAGGGSSLRREAGTPGGKEGGMPRPTDGGGTGPVAPDARLLPPEAVGGTEGKTKEEKPKSQER